MPVPPAETMSPPTSAWACEQEVHGRGDLRPLLGRGRLDHHEVALVAHDAADGRGRARGRGRRGAPASLGRAAAAGQADVDVDEHLADAVGGGGVDGRVAVDGHRDAGVARRPWPGRRRGSRVSLARSRSSPRPAAAMPTISRGVAQVNAVWPWAAWRAGEGGALVGLHVGAQRGPGRAAAMVARLCSRASASMTSAGVPNPEHQPPPPPRPLVHGTAFVPLLHVTACARRCCPQRAFTCTGCARKGL